MPLPTRSDVIHKLSLQSSDHQTIMQKKKIPTLKNTLLSLYWRIQQIAILMVQSSWTSNLEAREKGHWNTDTCSREGFTHRVASRRER